MTFPNVYLLPNERIALIEALRRDVENERNKAVQDPEWMAYHLHNVRVNVRIIEAFGCRLERDNFTASEFYKRSTIRSSS
jgi:hypothetical protein